MILCVQYSIFNNMYDIVTIGSATRDVFIKTDSFIKIKKRDLKIEINISPNDVVGILPLGSKVEIDNIHFDIGGGATNAAVSFARKGFKVVSINALGNDFNGHYIKKALLKENVNTLFQKIKDKFTGYSLIIVGNEGNRTVLVYRGASSNLNIDKIKWNLLKNAKWFYITSLDGNMDLLERIIKFCKYNNIKIAFNPGSQELKHNILLMEFLKNVDILILNQEEAANLCEFSFDKTDDIIKKLANLTISNIFVMTKSRKGVVVSDGTNFYEAGIFKEREAVDRTGAGDAFGSGFLAGFLKKGIKEGIREGSANSTSVLEYMGAKQGLLTLNELKSERWKMNNLNIKKHF